MVHNVRVYLTVKRERRGGPRTTWALWEAPIGCPI